MPSPPPSLSLQKSAVCLNVLASLSPVPAVVADPGRLVVEGRLGQLVAELALLADDGGHERAGLGGVAEGKARTRGLYRAGCFIIIIILLWKLQIWSVFEQ